MTTIRLNSITSADQILSFKLNDTVSDMTRCVAGYPGIIDISG